MAVPESWVLRRMFGFKEGGSNRRLEKIHNK
jgi:hypothetical protein